MFCTLTSLPSMLIILLCFCLDSSAGFCMPCQELNKKNTLWDLDRSFHPQSLLRGKSLLFRLILLVVADHSGTFSIIKGSPRYA